MPKRDSLKIRTFICLELPEEIRNYIYKEMVQPLKTSNIRCSWVSPENIHLTLKFLGDISTEKIELIEKVIFDSTENIEDFEVQLSKMGTFGGRRIRVVWTGIDGDVDRIGDLAKNLDKALSKIGFKREKRKFSAHITLGRIRDQEGIERLLEILRGIEVKSDSFTINRVILMKSELTPRGSIYSPLGVFHLNN